MRQINIEPYKVNINPEEQIDYDVRGSLLEILFHPDLLLGAKDILNRDTLARKIEAWPDFNLLLEEEEYKKVVAGVNALKGLTRRDVEFARRVIDAPPVEVQVKVGGHASLSVEEMLRVADE